MGPGTCTQQDTELAGCAAMERAWKKQYVFTANPISLKYGLWYILESQFFLMFYYCFQVTTIPLKYFIPITHNLGTGT